jgi:hypothetical protein
MLEPQNYTKYSKMESPFSEFKELDNLTEVTTPDPVEGKAGKITAASSGDVNLLGGAFGRLNSPRIWTAWFYDDNATAGGGEFYFTAHQQLKTPLDAYGQFSLGIDDASAHLSKYVYKSSAGSVQSTGVNRTKAWHKMAFFSRTSFLATRTFIARQAFIDGNRVVNLSGAIPNPENVNMAGATNANPCVITAASIPGDDHNYLAGDEILITGVVGMTELNGNVYTVQAPITGTTFAINVDSTSFGTYTSGGLCEYNGLNFSTQWRTFGLGSYVNGGGNNSVIDEIILNNGADIHETGTAQIDCTPTKVNKFKSSSVTEDTTGAWLGTTLYEVSFSTDGGTNFGSVEPYTNGLFLTMTDANLQSFICDGDGNDVLRIKVSLIPDTTWDYEIFAPRCRQVVVNFIPMSHKTLTGVGI